MRRMRVVCPRCGSEQVKMIRSVDEKGGYQFQCLNCDPNHTNLMDRGQIIIKEDIGMTREDWVKQQIEAKEKEKDKTTINWDFPEERPTELQESEASKKARLQAQYEKEKRNEVLKRVIGGEKE